MSSSSNVDRRASAVSYGVVRTARAPAGAHCVSRTLQALELLTFQSLSAPQVAAALQVSPRTARRLLLGMAADGYIEQTLDGRRRYRSTLRLAALGSQLVAHAALPRAAVPFVADLGARTGAVAHLVIPSYRGAVCVVHCDRPQAAEPPEPALRELLPAHATAPGKVLLAHRQPWRDSVLAEPPPRYTDRTMTSTTAIEAAMTAIRERGYAVDDGEYRPDAVGIAAPIFTHREVPAALAVTIAHSTPSEQQTMHALIEELVRAAAALTSALDPPQVPT